MNYKTIAGDIFKYFSNVTILMLIIFIIFISLNNFLTEASEFNSGFKGKVIDICTEEPIIGAIISIKSLGISTISNFNGEYQLEVPPGIFEVFVQASDYIGMSDTLQKVTHGTITNLCFEMIPLNPTPEQREIIDAKLIVPQKEPDKEGLDRHLELQRSGRARSVPSTITVLMSDNSVIPMDMDEYLKGVVPKEMSSYWPLEALKAQAVAARCFAAVHPNKWKHPQADVCTDPACCQAWSSQHYEFTNQAVENTSNEVATYNGNIIQAFFFGHCDGHTCNSEDVWIEALPYCRSVPCICGYSWLYGHGVGMCQRGAQAMANYGYDYHEILSHYYTGIGGDNSSPKFNIGDYVEVYNVGVTGLNVRSTPCGDPPIGKRHDGDIGQVLDGPVYCDNYNRWLIHWSEDGLEGWSAEDWLQKSLPPIDNPPVVNFISISNPSITLGDYFNISYSVSDDVGLSWVELWRTNDKNDQPDENGWTQIGPQYSISGKSYSGEFYDSPSSPGVYWYGIHVGDTGVNWATETNPIKGMVTSVNQPPTLSSGGVSPSSGTTSTTFIYSVNYYDPDGDSPAIRWVYIYTGGWSSHNMTLSSGSASNGTYTYSTNLSAVTHYYYFYFDDGTHAVWLPAAGSYYTGPTVYNPPSITTSSLPSGTQNQFYSASFSATDGTTPYIWSKSSGTFPSGLSLSSSGVLSGTPTNYGNFNFTIQVMDSGGRTDSKLFTLYINQAIATRIIRLEGDLNFGSVQIGNFVQKTLTIYNDGNSTLTVYGINCPAGFSGNWSGTISAGGFRNVDITFSPTQVVTYSGYLIVNSNATSGTNTKLVSGTGVPSTYPPQITTNDASNITSTSAQLNGNLDSIGNLICQVWFECGKTTSYGISTTKQSKSSVGPFNETIISLDPNTIYHFKTCASNSEGAAYGTDKTFTTKANSPGTSPFSNVTTNSIRANWTANGNPVGTQYYCENTTKGTNSAWTTNLDWNSTELSDNSTYHFQVKAKNKDGVETNWTDLGSQKTDTGTSANLELTPPTQSVTVGNQANINVVVEEVINLRGANIILDFDASKLQYVSSADGGFIPSATLLEQSIDNTNGSVTLDIAGLGASAYASGSGTIMTVVFERIADGNTNITFGTTTLRDKDNITITHTKGSGCLITFCLGDLNSDLVIDFEDLMLFAMAYGSCEGDANWNPVCDLNSDGCIEFEDLMIFAMHYGETCTD